MIQAVIKVRDKHKEYVKNFCSEHNIIWDRVYGEFLGAEGVHGTGVEVQMVENYVVYLERERKNKSFWWRLWN